jgi:hypothetical protein
MDRLNRSPKAARSEFSELIADGLVLWRLSTAGQADLWCMVFEHPGSFCIVLDNDPEGTEPYKICEEHPDIVRLLQRAEALKGSLLECGWTDVDVE